VAGDVGELVCEAGLGVGEEVDLRRSAPEPPGAGDPAVEEHRGPQDAAARVHGPRVLRRDDERAVAMAEEQAVERGQEPGLWGLGRSRAREDVGVAALHPHRPDLARDRRVGAPRVAHGQPRPAREVLRARGRVRREVAAGELGEQDVAIRQRCAERAEPVVEEDVAVLAGLADLPAQGRGRGEVDGRLRVLGEPHAAGAHRRGERVAAEGTLTAQGGDGRRGGRLVHAELRLAAPQPGERDRAEEREQPAGVLRGDEMQGGAHGPDPHDGALLRAGPRDPGRRRAREARAHAERGRAEVLRLDADHRAHGVGNRSAVLPGARGEPLRTGEERAGGFWEEVDHVRTGDQAGAAPRAHHPPAVKRAHRQRWAVEAMSIAPADRGLEVVLGLDVAALWRAPAPARPGGSSPPAARSTSSLGRPAGGRPRPRPRAPRSSPRPCTRAAWAPRERS